MGLILMPALGADVEAGTLVAWLKRPGDLLACGEVVAVVETGRGTMAIESRHTGMLQAVLAEPGNRVLAGMPLAMIAESPDDSAKPPARPATAEAPPRAGAEDARSPSPAPSRVVAPEPGTRHPGRLRVTPAARARALQDGVDLATIRPTGPDGAIVLADVLAAVEPSPAPPDDGSGFTAVHAVAAPAEAHSGRDVSHHRLAHTVDLTAADAFLAARNADRPPERHLWLTALFIKATACAAGQHPAFNGHLVNDRFSPSQTVHVGLAMGTAGGSLALSAIPDADRLTLDASMARLRDIVEPVRTGRLPDAGLPAPTISVTSLGEDGVEQVWGIIPPTQVAIVGFGSPSLRPIAMGECITARRAVTITLVADHRVGDSHAAALFLKDINRRLQEPEAL